ncbi:hypothetical protein [Herbidospora daliensis]|uniref:hypothetical protein n=1 Tax=Herbidospora daliensis TaxID=295585 RepID=UPI000783009E|nr:hypothetical protein [Herbidospora daliensis]
MKKILALVAVAVLGLAFIGPAVASAADPEPAKSYGVCVSKATGDLRALERNRLPKSVYGKCQSSETRITLPSVTGVTPARLVFRWPAETWSCPRVAAATTSTVWTFSCTSTPVPSPSPSS